MIMATEEREIRHFFDFSIEHFPDRSARWLLQNWENVRGLIEILASELAPLIDFSRLVPLNRSFIPDTLREQESDLVFRVPFKSPGRSDDLLIYILIEHQSTVDATMGFRMLFYMLLIWDAQRREWDQKKVPQSERRLRPILPIVFYTGDRRWETPLGLESLMDIPEELSRFVPRFDTLFLNVKETDATTLTKADHPFGWLLTVLQKEGATKETLSEVLIEAVLHLDTLDAAQAAQRREAILYLVSLILYRRPAEEHQELVSLVERHTPDMEVETMAQSMAEVLMERGIEQGIERGIEQGIEQGIERGIERGMRETTIKNIRSVLTARFPQHNLQPVAQALASIRDTDRLTRLHLTAVQAPSFEAFLQALDT